MHLSFCSNCGTKRQESKNKFCNECGEVFPTYAKENTEYTARHFLAPNMSILKGEKRRKFILFGVPILLVLFFVFINPAREDSAQEVAEKFLEYSSESEHETAVTELGSQNAIVSPHDSMNLTTYFTSDSVTELYEYEILTEEVKGDKAQVSAKLVFKNG